MITIDSATQIARDAAYRQDWTTAFAILTAARDDRPDDPQRHVDLGFFLWYADRQAEAEQVLAAAVARFPSSFPAAIEYASVAARRADWDEAMTRWRHVRERFPHAADGWIGEGAALLDAGRVDEGEAVIVEALTTFPEVPEPAVWYVSVALRRGQWAEAERRFAARCAAFPADATVSLTRQKIEYMARVIGESEGRMPAPDASGDLEMPMRFESLGGDCEFGMVQRRFGFEPVGLFRFAGARSGALLKAIETRCEGIGAPENTSLYVRNRGREYVAIDPRLNIVWRTSEYQYAADRKRLLQEQQRQLTYLGRKLVGDLEAAQKIFVYNSQTPLDLSYCESLARAIHQYSSSAILLCVGPTTSPDAPRVRRGGTGLLLAERRCVVRHWCWADEVTSPPYREWLAICTRAIELAEAEWT